MTHTSKQRDGRERPRVLHPRLYLGTSSWSSRDWEGSFYPRGTSPRDYLAHYTRRYRAVEADSTWYRAPSPATVRRWRDVLPEGFIFCAKVPRTITHEKVLVDCGGEMRSFLSTMGNLGEALGPLLLQFPYFNRASGMTAPLFRERLRPFLASLPEGYRFAVEVRNKDWIDAPLLETLRERGAGLALLDHPWMTPVEQMVREIDPATAGFVYVRWLGDRRGIERLTRSWDRTIVDRSERIQAWAGTIRALLERDLTVFGFFNNHYAGHAPGSIDLFERIWETSAPQA